MQMSLKVRENTCTFKIKWAVHKMSIPSFFLSVMKVLYWCATTVQYYCLSFCNACADL